MLYFSILLYLGAFVPSVFVVPWHLNTPSWDQDI
jgi:hypothetical protein